MKSTAWSATHQTYVEIKVTMNAHDTHHTRIWDASLWTWNEHETITMYMHETYEQKMSNNNMWLTSHPIKLVTAVSMQPETSPLCPEPRPYNPKVGRCLHVSYGVIKWLYVNQWISNEWAYREIKSEEMMLVYRSATDYLGNAKDARKQRRKVNSEQQV